MNADPLSESTRKARKNLMIFSCALLVAIYFNAKISNIPFAGIELTIDEQALPTLLGVGLVYFLISFGIYAVDDLVNLANTPFQTEYIQKSGEAYERAKTTFESNAVAVLRRHMDIREAEFTSKELAKFVNVVGNDRESFFQDRIEYELKSYSGRIDNNSLGALSMSLMNVYKRLSKDFDIYSKDSNIISSRLRNYSTYRMARLYGFELAFPVGVAVAALMLAMF